MTMRFKVARTQGDQPTWWLLGSNGEQVAWAGESFASDANAHRAHRAAAAFKAAASTARYEVYEDTGQQWRWRAWVSSDKVAASGEAFASRAHAQRAADLVRDEAGTADL